MATIGKTSYIFISIIAVLFILSFMLALFAGLNVGSAIIWCISNFLNVSYPGIIPAAIAYKNPLLLAADLLGALDFPISLSDPNIIPLELCSDASFKYSSFLKSPSTTI